MFKLIVISLGIILIIFGIIEFVKNTTDNIPGQLTIDIKSLAPVIVGILSVNYGLSSI